MIGMINFVHIIFTRKSVEVQTCSRKPLFPSSNSLSHSSITSHSTLQSMNIKDNFQMVGCIWDASLKCVTNTRKIIKNFKKSLNTSVLLVTMHTRKQPHLPPPPLPMLQLQ